MVIPAGQLPELPVVTLAAGIFLAGIAPAVAAPVAKRLNEHLQIGLVSQHRSTLTHGDMVRRVEADGGNIAKRAHLAPLPRRPERIAAILTQPEIVFLDEGGDSVKVKDVAQRMGNHD